MAHRHGPGCGARCFILPPHIVDAIARNGSAAEAADARATAALSQQLRTVRAEAPRGAMLLAAPALPTVLRRTVGDTQSTQFLPGTTVWDEGQPDSADPAVVEAVAGLGATYALYRDVFERDSIDGKGMALLASVHYGEQYDNAFWDGAQMVFGDGDGSLFNRFTLCLEVIGHELTHGVTAHQANLEYNGQSGALNESMSDVFGSLVKQYAASPQQTAEEASWLIGEGLLGAKVNGRALRDMAAPGTAYDDPVLGKDPQPADMSGYVTTQDDAGGVHLNSSIPNLAFVRFARAVGGPAWEVPGTVWYRTLCDPRLSSGASFNDFAELTALVAKESYGGEPWAHLMSAWKSVGLDIS